MYVDVDGKGEGSIPWYKGGVSTNEEMMIDDTM